MSLPIAAVFLDRDGTIIEDTHYPRDPDLVIMLPNAAAGIKKLNEKGYPVFVVSNQSGVGRGIIKDSEFRAVHAKVCENLQAEGVKIEEFFYCFHKPEDECNCRKPRPGLIPKSYQGRPFDFARCFVVGDRDADLDLAKAIGAQGFLVLTGKGKDTLKEVGSEVSTCVDLLDFAARLPHLTQA